MRAECGDHAAEPVQPITQAALVFERLLFRQFDLLDDGRTLAGQGLENGVVHVAAMPVGLTDLHRQQGRAGFDKLAFRHVDGDDQAASWCVYFRDTDSWRQKAGNGLLVRVVAAGEEDDRRTDECREEPRQRGGRGRHRERLVCSQGIALVCDRLRPEHAKFSHH